MTSKALFYKFFKQDIKKRLWLFFVALVGLLFSIPVLTLMKISRAIMRVRYTSYYDKTLRIKYASDYFLDRAFFSEHLMLVVIFLAVFLGIMGFSYLHSKKQVDFYHSIPITKTKLFLTRYLGGLFIYGVAYGINMILTIILSMFYQVPFGEMLAKAFVGAIINLIFFTLIYSVVILASVITGHILINLLGAVTFLFYGAGFLLLADSLRMTFFYSYYRSIQSFHEKGYLASPIITYQKALEWDYQKQNIFAYLMISMIVSLIITGIYFQLYQQRPLEEAGSAIVFKRLKAPIKMLLIIPISLAIGMVFYELIVSPLWMIFGAICGLLVLHSLMEVIYHFDFRAITKNKIHLLICGAGISVIFSIHYFDMLGYDSYLPKKEQIKSAQIEFVNFQQWDDNFVIKESDSGWVYYEHMRMDSFEMMELLEYEHLLNIAKSGIAYSEMTKSHKRNYEVINLINAQDRSDDYYADVNIQYQLKNGRTVRRTYYMPLKAELESAEAIFTSEEYKKGAFYIMNLEANDVERVTLGIMSDYEVLDLTKAEVERLLAAYQQDFLQLTITDMKNLGIKGELQFLTKEQVEGISNYNTSEKNNNQFLGYCQYPIYESFENTLKVLATLAVTEERYDFTDKVLNVEVPLDYIWGSDYYGSYGMQSSSDGYERMREIGAFAYNSKEEIAALLEFATYQDYQNYRDSVISSSYARITTHTLENGTRKKHEFLIPIKHLPDFLKEDLDNLMILEE